jgi:uncharacterized protein YjbJ (UPF0337 family)
MEEWQARARYEGQRRGKQVMHNLEDNPLTYGAVALAAGVALALLLPQTRTENRYFGEMRDQVMDKGREVMESAKDQAQEVISEVRPELEEKARQLVSQVTDEVKEVGKEVASTAASELRPIMDKAVEKGKEAATNVAQEAGVDPNKLTGNKPSAGGSSGASSMGNKPASGTQASGSSTASSTSPSSTGHSGATSMGTGLSTGTGQTSLETPVVNRDTLAGQWKQLRGEVKSKWGQLTDDDLTKAEGDYDKLVGSIQSRYGYTRERVEREVNDWFNSRKA